MWRSAFAFGLAVGCLAGIGSLDAQEYDNPEVESVPCLVVTSFNIGPAGGGDYAGNAALENSCGRTIEVRFCFVLAAEVEGAENVCYAGDVRPWSGRAVEATPVPARIIDFETAWRFAPVVTPEAAPAAS